MFNWLESRRQTQNTLEGYTHVPQKCVAIPQEKLEVIASMTWHQMSSKKWMNR